VLFIGIDSGDPDLLQSWMADGSMPSLAALQRRALWGRTSNAPGLYSGSVWPSFHTGLQPGRHGRYFFRQFEPGTYRTAPFPAWRLSVPPFWKALDETGARVAIVDLPKAPVVSMRHGIQLADWGLHDPDGPTRSAPASLARDIVDRHGPDPLGPCGRAIRTLSLAEVRDLLVARVRQKQAIVTDLLDRGSWDLFATSFSESHCAGHQFWSLHDAGHERHDRAALAQLGGDPLRAVYAAIDAGIGAVLERVDSQTVVVVLGSHGMGPHYDLTFKLDAILDLLEPGRPTRTGPSAGGPSATRRMMAAVRSGWHLAPAGFRRRLSPLVDWTYDVWQARSRQARTFFQVPTNANCAGIRINVAGREPGGFVARGDEYDRVCQRLADQLREIVNVETGMPVVEEVLRTDGLFAGPQREALPDLLVRWRRTDPIRQVRSPRIGTVDCLSSEIRTGDHRNAGMFLAAGPGIAHGRRHEPVRDVDFAPTLAGLLGCSLDGVDGQPVPELVEQVR